MNKKLITDYMPLANSIACRKKKNLPKHITLDELKSSAYFGLVDAASKYNPSIGSFFNYASIRIEGAIKDHLKSLPICSINNSTQENNTIDSKNNFVETNDFFDFISSKISIIEYRIILMYYREFKTMKEIGDLEKLSESRISQIISKSHGKLRKALEEVYL